MQLTLFHSHACLHVMHLLSDGTAYTNRGVMVHRSSYSSQQRSNSYADVMALRQRWNTDRDGIAMQTVSHDAVDTFYSHASLHVMHLSSDGSAYTDSGFVFHRSVVHRSYSSMHRWDSYGDSVT